MSINQLVNALRMLAGIALAALAVTGPARADFDSPIRHVFVIVLENEGFDTTFGPNSKAPYLSKTLTSQGVLLQNYYGTGHASLDNYIAMISGQAATPDTRNDCQTYKDFVMTGVTPDGQAIGQGCIYTASIKTIADQLTAAGKTWRAYMGDMGNDPNRESATCGHPVVGATDHTQIAEKPSTAVPLGDNYATRHNPFMYFHSIIDSPACQTGVVNLNQLTQDLQSAATTPNLVFITPSLCDDGHDAPCADGRPGGLVSADAFLQKWVPIITSSPAFKRSGLLIVNFDEGGAAIAVNTSNGSVTVTFEGRTCCNEQPGPNLGPFPQSSTIPGTAFTLVAGSYGGDQTGAVLLSPFLKPSTVSNSFFNHYSLLKTIEDIFELRHLGYAGQQGLLGFFDCVSSDVATRRDDDDDGRGDFDDGRSGSGGNCTLHR